MTTRPCRNRGDTRPKHGRCLTSHVFAVARGAALVAALAALLGMVAAVVGPEARAQDGERFVSLKAERANLRVGPGRRYPIEWVYTRPGLPLLVIAHFDQWRWVRDHEGTKGWMHKSLLSTRRTAIVMNGVQTMRERPLSGSPAVLRAEAGVIADLLGCEDGWCQIALAGEDGWMPESALWGTRAPAP
ncbi:MAG: SH3 domain-containing protein [Rhodospirillales bacterium]|nr:SH3 domain-containing protein [Rhodospirillales bacterium]